QRSVLILALVAVVSGNHVLDELRDRVISPEAEQLTGQALVDYVNANQQLFKTKLNSRFAGMSEERKKKMVNGIAAPIADLAAELDREGRVTHDANIDIPESFDARTAWHQCSTIGLIRDQSVCGACWAFIVSEVISDRICIASGGSKQYNISAADLISCCEYCGAACGGGLPLPALKYWVAQGLVTGSNYEDQLGCMPYPFPPCEHHNNNTGYPQCTSMPHGEAAECSKTCQPGYSLTYAQDKHYGKSAYGINKRVRDIQIEIMKNGPVAAAFDVYEDFLQYSGGVYFHLAGDYAGGHGVKVIGWGVDGTTPYWLAVNSWNEDWGENGLFRIIRGIDNCGFELAMVAGLPK
ncbi:hypothetical protein PMAYCL1PPCAC_33165, partial [Pristionchus mayeri]